MQHYKESWGQDGKDLGSADQSWELPLDIKHNSIKIAWITCIATDLSFPRSLHIHEAVKSRLRNEESAFIQYNLL